MTKYAEGTSVPPARTRAEIESTLERFGATAFGYTTSADGAQVAFEISDLRVRIRIAMPDPADFTRTPTGLMRSPSATAQMVMQAQRQRWRALLLVVKAKLEAVESGIETAEQAWFPYVVLPNGQTVYDQARPEIARAMSTGQVGPLLDQGLPAIRR